jgi:hypothetical protein
MTREEKAALVNMAHRAQADALDAVERAEDALRAAKRAQASADAMAQRILALVAAS